jgi:hypothetical protein
MNIAVSKVIVPVEYDKVWWNSPAGGDTVWGAGQGGSGPQPDKDFTAPLAKGPEVPFELDGEPRWFEWESDELTEAVASWIGGKEKNYGFTIYGISTNLLAHFASFDSPDKEKHPQLVIEYKIGR